MRRGVWVARAPSGWQDHQARYYLASVVIGMFVLGAVFGECYSGDDEAYVPTYRSSYPLIDSDGPRVTYEPPRVPNLDYHWQRVDRYQAPSVEPHKPYAPSYRVSHAPSYEARDYLRQRESELRRMMADPHHTWLQKKLEHDIKKSAQTAVSVAIAGGTWSATSIAGLGLEGVHAVLPDRSRWRKPCQTAKHTVELADIGRAIYSGGVEVTLAKQIADRSIFRSDFDPHAKIVETRSVRLDRTWQDEFRKTYVTGHMSHTKAFIPDPDSFRRGVFPWGRTTDSWRRHYTIVETVGIRDLDRFRRQWNIQPIYGTPFQRNYQTYRVEVPRIDFSNRLYTYPR